MRNAAKLLLTVSLLVGVVGSAAAADAGHDKVRKVKVTDTHHKEHKLDLSKAEDRALLNQLIEEGAVLHMQEDIERSLLDLKWDLGFWTVIVFILLFLILRKAAWGPMLEGLKKREENIQAALVEAREARAEARQLKDELAAEREKAAAKVAEMMAEARRDAEYTRNEMMSKAKAEIQLERDRLLREVNTAKDQALQEIWKQAAELATLISSKAVKRSLSIDDHRRLVDEAIADMGVADHERRRLQGL